jgi:hypothetical protein
MSKTQEILESFSADLVKKRMTERVMGRYDAKREIVNEILTAAIEMAEDWKDLKLAIQFMREHKA